MNLILLTIYNIFIAADRCISLIKRKQEKGLHDLFLRRNVEQQYFANVESIGLAKSSFEFFHKMLSKSLSELFGQPSMTIKIITPPPPCVLRISHIGISKLEDNNMDIK